MRRLRHHLFYWFREYRPIMVAWGLAVVGVSVVALYVSKVTRDLTTHAAIAEAESVSHALRAFRTLYTSEVVERLRSQGISITHDYRKTQSSIPLPATLMLRLGEELSTNEGGRVRLFSDYPFPWRVDGGPHSEFERDALLHLTGDPTRPFYQLEETDGRRRLLYATADIMRASCVSCHNSHPDSPKNDWKEGDVRGALAVSVDLDEIGWGSARDVRGLVALLVVMAVMGSFGFIMLIARTKRKAQAEAEHTAERSQTKEKDDKLLQALKLAENHRLALNEHAFVSIADIRGTIIHANDKFCEISGYSREELIGQDHRILKSEEHSADFYRDLWRTISKGAVWSGEIKNLRKDRSSYWVDATIVPFKDEHGRIEKYVAVRTDISAIKFAEERLVAANAELREFNGAVVDRELRMIELKQEVNSLSEELGGDKRYDVTENDRISPALAHDAQAGQKA